MDMSVVKESAFFFQAEDGFQSSGMWLFVTGWVVPNISKECIALVFRDQEVHEELSLLHLRDMLARSDG